MKNTFKAAMSVLTLSALLISCGNGNEEKKVDSSQPSTSDTTKVVKEEKKSLTKSEAEALVKTYVKENKKKYASLGTVVDSKLVSGDYDGDSFTDFLITVSFHDGVSEFYDPVYFFFNSVNEELNELKLARSKGYINGLSFKSLTKATIPTEAFVWHDFAGEKSFKCNLSIEGNKLIIPKSALSKAEKLFSDLEFEHELSLMDPARDPENAE